MEAYDKGTKPEIKETTSENNTGRVLAGSVIVLVGVLFLADRLGMDIPHWIFSWEMFLIGIGLYIGAKKSFKPGGWMIIIAIGTIFLIDNLYYDIYLKPYIWPIVLIGVGIYIMVKPKRSRRNSGWNEPIHVTNTGEQKWESVSIFGGNKNIISKDFKGGEVVTIMGGTEINMAQADITGTVTLQLTQVFGGTKLIVPGNWKIETSEMVSVFGGIDDKRHSPNTQIDETKVLRIVGTSIFGGIDIRSY